jgi:hypothetical protein
MDVAKTQWELIILDAAPPANALDGLVVGDVVGGGHL